MREIKFRVWDKEEKKMYPLKTVVDFMYTDEAKEEGGGSSPYVLMQFTGLKDRNGKEIYEGDICMNGEWEEDAGAYHYTNDVVRWDNNNACWLGWNYDENEFSCEVIGNIYENPELLNKLSDKENG